MSKIAIVTGGSRGIGLACARQLTKDGYTVIATGRTPGVTLPDGITYRVCDSRDVDAVRALVDWVGGQFGTLDLLVSNAGVAPPVRTDVLQTTTESYDYVMDINLRGAFFLMQAAARLMLADKEIHPGHEKRMICISSVSADTVSVNRGEYCISKAGLSMAAALFAVRLAPAGIPVFEVRPGIIATDMTAAVQQDYKRRIAEGLTPVPRIGVPADVALCVSALAGGKMDFAAGQVVYADGGLHIPRL